ncbi:MAG: hypothetical protein PHZ00_02070 [Candidatus Peribacteraceae bacterium]|nr:hypothetical protein [Candidatus Peribacteraceae bacterium]
MADQSQPPATSLLIPPEILAQFGPIIELVKGSESMNNEERQYWVNILPIMTPDQRKNLEDILVSEKQQLAAIDAKYSRNTQPPVNQASVAEVGLKIREKKQEREQMEQVEQAREAGKETDILSQIQAL